MRSDESAHAHAIEVVRIVDKDQRSVRTNGFLDRSDRSSHC